jgi:hypothetical protein
MNSSWNRLPMDVFSIQFTLIQVSGTYTSATLILQLQDTNTHLNFLFEEEIVLSGNQVIPFGPFQNQRDNEDLNYFLDIALID